MYWSAFAQDLTLVTLKHTPQGVRKLFNLIYTTYTSSARNIQGDEQEKTWISLLKMQIFSNSGYYTKFTMFQRKKFRKKNVDLKWLKDKN